MINRYCCTNEKAFEIKASGLKVAAAATRNSPHIINVLKHYIPLNIKYNLLEIASGTGQHAFDIAKAFDNIYISPSDCYKEALESINKYGNMNDRIEKARIIDVSKDFNSWNIEKKESYDGALCVNMIHITPWISTIGLFNGMKYALKPNGQLFTYGPYRHSGTFNSEGNMKFDQSLRERNAEWGIRDIDDLKELANTNDFELTKVIDVPANNNILVFTKNK